VDEQQILPLRGRMITKKRGRMTAEKRGRMTEKEDNLRKVK
jgi:hypothetical protein